MLRDVVPLESRRPSGTALVLVLLSALLGCHECGRHGGVGHQGDLVGGPCLDEHDCAQLCLEGGRYPDGTCSVECENDDDCPDGTWCVDLEGGVCLLGCGGDNDCRAAYECSGRERKGTPGDVLTCRDD